MNQPNLARYQLEEAIKTTPSDPEPYVILGNIALQERRIAEATMDFDKAKQLLATYTNDERKAAMEQQTMSGIAQVAESREDWKEAEAQPAGALEARARGSGRPPAPGPVPVLARQGRAMPTTS